MLYLKLSPISSSVTFLFMYLGKPLEYYQSIPQGAQTLHFSLLINCLCVNLKSCFVLLNASSCSVRFRQVSISIFLALGLLNTSSRSVHCWLELTWVSPSFLHCFGQHLESLCSWKKSHSVYRQESLCLSSRVTLFIAKKTVYLTYIYINK